MSKQHEVTVGFLWAAFACAFGVAMGSGWEQGKNRRVMDEIKVTRAEDVKRGIELSRIEQLKKVSRIEKSVEDHLAFYPIYTWARVTMDWIELDDAGREKEVERLLTRIRKKELERRSSLDARWTKKSTIQLFNENPQAITLFRELMAGSEQELQELKSPEHMKLMEVLLATAEKAGYESTSDVPEDPKTLDKLFAVRLLEDYLPPNLPHMPE